MNSIRRFLAFDIGATSGRSIVASLNEGKFESEELTRFPNPMLHIHGKYYWDIYSLLASMKEALRACAKQKIEIESIGIDTWGVDFGYIGADGTILSLPRAYRDPYTDGAPERYFDIVPRKEVYDLTGIQIMNFNSLYQLFAANEEGFTPLKQAEEILFMPDLLSYLLTGEKVIEYTIASTSQMINPRSGEFEARLLEKAGCKPSLVRTPVMPGHIIGYLTEDIMSETGVGRIPVVAVAGHDTAAAVVAVPAESDRFAYLSSGTWSLMGIEVNDPIINDRAFELNFTNEGGINGTTRFLKNITGMWLLEQCRRQWAKEGREYTYQQIDEMSTFVAPFKRFINPDYPAFGSPIDMPKAIIEYCEATGQTAPRTDAEFIRCIFESLALRYKVVLNLLEEVSPFPIDKLHVIGGGSKNDTLNQWTCNAIGKPVVAGPGEATAIGNFMVQAMAMGVVSSLSEIREVIKNSVSTTIFQPTDTKAWRSAFERFKQLK